MAAHRKVLRGAAGMRRGSPSGVDLGSPIDPKLINALQHHAELYSDLIPKFTCPPGGRATVSNVIRIALQTDHQDYTLDGGYHLRHSLKQLADLNQRAAIHTLMLHQALLWLTCASQALTSVPDERLADLTDDEIPF